MLPKRPVASGRSKPTRTPPQRTDDAIGRDYGSRRYLVGGIPVATPQQRKHIYNEREEDRQPHAVLEPPQQVLRQGGFLFTVKIGLLQGLGLRAQLVPSAVSRRCVRHVGAADQACPFSENWNCLLDDNEGIAKALPVPVRG